MLWARFFWRLYQKAASSCLDPQRRPTLHADMIKTPQAIMSAVLMSLGLVFATGCGPSKEELRLQTEAKRLEEERAASAKAEAEAKAALETKLAERTKVISEVLEFLNSAKPDGRRSGATGAPQQYTYANFVYNTDLKCLDFDQFYTVGGPIGASGSGTKWRVFLQEARPTLTSRRDANDPSAVCLELNGRATYTSVILAGGGDQDNFSALNAISPDEWQVQGVEFWLSEDLLPRVKKALEDLIGVHGASPLRY